MKRKISFFMSLILLASIIPIYPDFLKENKAFIKNVTTIEELEAKGLSTVNNKELISGIDLIPNATNATAIRQNTINLQKAIDEVSNNGGGTVYLPAGTFYFAKGGQSVSSFHEDYVIRCRNNVHLIGAGTDESSFNVTILKPIYDNQNGIGSLDMFYFNNYNDTNGNENYSYPTLTQTRDVSYYDINGDYQTLKNQTVYLTNADFSNFVIDSSHVKGGSYNTTGKGFMINLFANCDWDNIVVKNTDATGFGMDCPYNSTIKNSVAINCGKDATNKDGGASGFGIGTGLSNNESITITNCVSLNNKKYGFFFENQARFSPNNYKATTSNGFVVANSVAGGNLYDFGGLKANNVTYDNVKSVTGQGSYSVNNKSINLKANALPFHFGLYSVNNQFVNSNLSSNIKDITSYQEQVNWAINTGIIAPENATNYQPSKVISRENAITYLYLYKRAGGSVITAHTRNQQLATAKELREYAGFQEYTDNNIPDLRLENDNMDAILWGVKSGIISKDNSFRANDACTRAEFFTMLYRLAGKPVVNKNGLPFTDVPANHWAYDAIVWAYQNQITNGKSATSFAPYDKITKAEAAIALYRYNKSTNNTYEIAYNLLGGSTSNITFYTSHLLPYTLKNPTKPGYKFLGWTGSNGTTPSKNVTITRNTTGNLVYTANWAPVMNNIAIKTLPTRRNYNVGDRLDTTGLSIIATYGDGTTDIISKGFSVNKTTLNRVGTETITVTYNGLTTTFNVQVTKKDTSSTVSSISVKTLPTKTTYTLGETINTNGLTLYVKYSDGTSKTIDKGFSINPKTPTKMGANTITVTYGNQKTYFVVRVLNNNNDNGDNNSNPDDGMVTIPENPKTLSKIVLYTRPNKLYYQVGESLDTTGLSLKLIYNNGQVDIIHEGFTISNDDLSTPGTKNIKVSYQNKTIYYQVLVSDTVYGTDPGTVTIYKENEVASQANTTNNQSHTTNNNQEKSTKNPDTNKGNNEEKQTTTTKETSAVITGLEIKNNPQKLDYYVGDEIDTTDLTLVATYNDGTKKEINSGYTLTNPVLTESGVTTVEVDYNGYSDNFKVFVKDQLESTQEDNSKLQGTLTYQLKNNNQTSQKLVRVILSLIALIIIGFILFKQNIIEYRG